MKRHTFLTVLTASASLFAATLLVGANSKSAAPAAAPAPAPKQQKLFKVRTLNTVEENREFQANVQLVQAQREALIQLTGEKEKEKDAKKKQELQTQIDQITKKLTENNALMEKVYGFSLARNYTLEIEKANVYMLVTDEEAAKLEKEAAEAAKAAKSTTPEKKEKTDKGSKTKK